MTLYPEDLLIRFNSIDNNICVCLFSRYNYDSSDYIEYQNVSFNNIPFLEITFSGIIVPIMSKVLSRDIRN